MPPVPGYDENEEKKIKIQPYTSLQRVGQDLSKLEKYFLAPRLSLNIFFGFSDAMMFRIHRR